MNFDDQPVGQHNELVISEQPEDSAAEPSEAPKPSSPLTNRLVSKNPKVRLDAMSELLTLFTSDSTAFTEHYPLFPKYLADSHPGVQEKAIEAFTVLVSQSPANPDKTLSDSVAVLIEKGISSAKAQIKAKSLECLMALAELEDYHTIMKESLQSSLSTKTVAKIAAGALLAVDQLLINYGNKYFPVKEYIKLVTALAESTNAQVRAEVLAYLKEGYRWDKTLVLKTIEGLRQAQQEELKKQFAEINEPAKPLKYIKGAEIENVESKKEKPLDAYTLAAEVSVLKKFNDQWCAQIREEKKWNEKRNKLEDLLKAVSVEKIKNENFTELGKTLKLLVQDSNIAVSNLALKVIGQLAKALRNNLSAYAKHSFELVVQKLKDKKSVVEAQKCMENLAFSLKLEDMIEQIKETLGDKSPLIKARICVWLEQSVLPKVNADLLKTMGSVFGPILVKLTDDAISDVRENAVNCLRVMKTLLQDDSSFNKLIGELSSQKQEKLSKAPVKPQESEEKVKEAVPMSRPSKEPLKRSSTAPKHMLNKFADKLKKETTKPEVEEEVGEILLLEEAIKVVTETIPPEMAALFDSADWKERQKGIQEVKAWIDTNNSKAQEILDAVIVWLKGKLKDFKETNPGIVKECLGLLQTIADTCVTNKKFAYLVVPVLVERMNDLKSSEMCMSIILSIADSANPTYVTTLIINTVSNSKSINMAKGAISLLSKILDGYGANLIPLKTTVDYAKNLLAHSNAQLRVSATRYIVLVYEAIGDLINGWLGSDLKETTHKSLEIEFNKSKPHHSSEVKRTLKGESADFAAKNTKKDIADTLVPRANISLLITSKILAGLSDSSMKQRQEAKEAIEKILFSSNNRILPVGLNSLMNALKGRMSEPCKNLSKGFITLVGNLAAAMGQGFRQYHKILVQPLLCNLSDKQSAIRTETILAMDKIAEIGADLILNSVGVLLEKDNPEMRSSLMSWALKYKESMSKCDCQSYVGPLVLVMQDKSKEIREMAEQLVKVVMENVGHGAFVSAIQDLKPVVKISLEAMLDKYKPNLVTKIKTEENNAVSDTTSKETHEETIVENKPSENTVSKNDTNNEESKEELIKKSIDINGKDMMLDNEIIAKEHSITPNEENKTKNEVIDIIENDNRKVAESSNDKVDGIKDDKAKETSNEPIEETKEMTHINDTIKDDCNNIIPGNLMEIIKEENGTNKEQSKDINLDNKDFNSNDEQLLIQTTETISEERIDINLDNDSIQTNLIEEELKIPDLKAEMQSVDSDLLGNQIVNSATKESDKFNFSDSKERLPAMSSKSVINKLAIPVKSLTSDSHMDALVRCSFQKTNTPAESELDTTKSPNKPLTKAEMVTCRSTNDLTKRFESRRIGKAKEVKKISRKMTSTKTKLTSQSPKRGRDSSSRCEAKSNNLVIGSIGSKEKRAESDKVFKWPINEIREDYVEKLKKTLKNAIRQNLFEAMFSPQFKKNILALNLLTEGLNNEFSGLLDLADLFFKWIVTKLVDQSNTMITKAIFEFLSLFFKQMEETSYHMLDFEAVIILPMLCERLGGNFQQQVRELLKMASSFYNISKLASHLLSTMEVTKNQKTKIECVGMLKELANKHGAAKIYPAKCVKNFAKLLLSQDNTLKNESMETLIDIYRSRGESIWTLVGEIPEKYKEMLRKRFSSISFSESIQSSNSSNERRPITPNIELAVGASTSVDSKDKLAHEIVLTEQNRCINKDNFKMDEIRIKTPCSKQSEKAVSSITEQCEGPTENTSQLVGANAGAVSNEHKETSEEKIISMKIETFEQALEALRKGDTSRRVDALMFINDKTISSSEKEILASRCDDLLTTFAEVLEENFERPIAEIPIRFIKYLMTVINKICTSKTIIANITEHTFYLIAEQLLTKLLFNGLGQMGSNNEGEFLIKSFNSTMLRLLENCSPTKSFIILIELFKAYKKEAPMRGNIRTGKLPNLIVKCILKLSKVMDTIIHSLNVSRLLVCLHEYLIMVPNNRAPDDDVGIRLAKTIINDLVKSRGEAIWEDYKQVEQHTKGDIYIKRWISFTLKSYHGKTPKPVEKKTQSSDEALAELKEVFKQLNSKGSFQDGINNLSGYMMRHPEIDLEPYFVSCSKSFKDYVMDAVKRSSLSTQKIEETVKDKDDHKSTESTLLEWKSKLALLKQKLDSGKKEELNTTYKSTNK